MPAVGNDTLAQLINGSQQLGRVTLDCSDVVKAIGAKIGLFSWLLFILTCYLMVAHVLKARAAKGKTHLSSLRGAEWFDKTVIHGLVIYFMGLLWLLVYGGFGV